MQHPRNTPNIKNRPCFKVKGYNKIFYANWSKKQAGVAILISDKVDYNKNKQHWGRTLHTHQTKNLPRGH